MKKLLLSIAFLPILAFAQEQGTLPSFTEYGFFATHDSGKFASQTAFVGAAASNGIGARVGYSHYSAPGQSFDSPFVQATYVHAGKDLSIFGAAGVKTGVNGNVFIGQFESRKVVSESFAFGFSVNADVVESIASIKNGTSFYSIGANFDYLVAENLNVFVGLYDTEFSDNNSRQTLKTKTTWTFYPEQGVSAYVRTKDQRDSSPGKRDYFSPESSDLIVGGFQIRKFINGLVYTGAIDYGTERITTLGGDVSKNGVYTWNLGLQTAPAKRNGVTFGAMLISSNTSIASSSNENYTWYGLYSWLKIPF